MKFAYCLHFFQPVSETAENWLDRDCYCQVFSVLSDSVWPHPWDSPGKNTGVDCHFLLQCIKVKSESEVTQLCLTLRDPMDCSLPGSSIHGVFQARVLEWGAIVFSCLHIRSVQITPFEFEWSDKCGGTPLRELTDINKVYNYLTLSLSKARLCWVSKA